MILIGSLNNFIISFSLNIASNGEILNFHFEPEFSTKKMVILLFICILFKLKVDPKKDIVKNRNYAMDCQ